MAIEILAILIAFVMGIICARLLSYEKQDKIRNKVLNMYPRVMRDVWLDRQALRVRYGGEYKAIQVRIEYLDDILHRYEQAMVDAEQASESEWNLQWGLR